MKRMITWLAVALGLVFLPLAAGAQDKLPIRIGFQSGDINVILMYAVNTGLFEKNGLEVKTSTFPAGPTAQIRNPAHQATPWWQEGRHRQEGP